MHVSVRLFARQRELFGARTTTLELPDGASILDVWAALVERCPALAPGGGYLRYSRNRVEAPPGERLDDGDEVAFIPPVSGGSGADGGGDARLVLELREAPFGRDIVADLIERVATDADGGVAVFVGRTRETADDPRAAEASGGGSDERVVRLEYEAFAPMAEATLREVAAEVAERFGVRRLAIVHRVGEVPLGEPSVVVVAASPHRGEAFAAARYAIDETKRRAPIWKAEHTASGHRWVEGHGEPSADRLDP